MSFQQQKRIVAIINLSFLWRGEDLENFNISNIRELFADHKSM